MPSFSLARAFHTRIPISSLALKTNLLSRLQTSSPTSADMAHLVLSVVLSTASSSISTSNNSDASFLGEGHYVIHQCFSTICKVLKLKYSSRTIPHHHPSSSHYLCKQCSRLRTTVQTHPTIRDTISNSSSSNCSILSKLVTGHKVNR